MINFRQKWKGKKTSGIFSYVYYSYTCDTRATFAQNSPLFPHALFSRVISPSCVFCTPSRPLLKAFYCRRHDFFFWVASLTHILTHTHSRTHTRTHTHKHTHKHAHTHTRVARRKFPPWGVYTTRTLFEILYVRLQAVTYIYVRIICEKEI